MKRTIRMSLVAFTAAAMSTTAFADMDAAKKWVDSEFQPSTLSKDDQLKEMDKLANQYTSTVSQNMAESAL